MIQPTYACSAFEQYSVSFELSLKANEAQANGNWEEFSQNDSGQAWSKGRSKWKNVFLLQPLQNQLVVSRDEAKLQETGYIVPCELRIEIEFCAVVPLGLIFIELIWDDQVIIYGRLDSMFLRNRVESDRERNLNIEFQTDEMAVLLTHGDWRNWRHWNKNIETF